MMSYMAPTMIWNKGKGHKVNRKTACPHKKNPIQLNLYKEEYQTTGNIHLSVWQASFLQHLMYSKNH